MMFCFIDCSDYRSRNGLDLMENNDGFTVLNVDPKNIEKDNNRVSLFAHSIQYVPLETRDSILIGDADKIIVKENKIYILDKMTESIFCFDVHNGDFLFKINEKGDGPDEYYSISNFAVNEKEEIIIYSSNQGLFYYNKEKFLKKINIHVIASDIYITKDDSIYFYIGRLPNPNISDDFPKQYRLVKTYNGSVVDYLLPFFYNDLYLKIPSNSNSFFTLCDTLNQIEYLNQETNYFVNGNLIPKYKIKFTTNNDDTFNFNNSLSKNSKIIDRIRKNDYTRLISYTESKNYIFISYNVNGLVLYSYITKKNLKINNAGIFYIDDFNNIPIEGDMKCIVDNQLIGVMDPITFFDLIKNKEDLSDNLHNVKNKGTISDNPILIKINLR